MSERPQDEGSINELCSQRKNYDPFELKLQDSVRVNQVDCYTELNSPTETKFKLLPLEKIGKGKILEHMDHQISLAENQQYSNRDDETKNFVYVYN